MPKRRRLDRWKRQRRRIDVVLGTSAFNSSTIAGLRPQPMTTCPASINRSVIDRPQPFVAPVMTIRLVVVVIDTPFPLIPQCGYSITFATGRLFPNRLKSLNVQTTFLFGSTSIS